MTRIRACGFGRFCSGQNAEWTLCARDTPARLPPMSVARRTIVGMRTLEICERCDGTGADPTQHVEEVTLCIECSGDGCHVTYYEELAQTA